MVWHQNWHGLYKQGVSNAVKNNPANVIRGKGSAISVFDRGEANWLFNIHQKQCSHKCTIDYLCEYRLSHIIRHQKTLCNRCWNLGVSQTCAQSLFITTTFCHLADYKAIWLWFANGLAVVCKWLFEPGVWKTRNMSPHPTDQFINYCAHGKLHVWCKPPKAMPQLAVWLMQASGGDAAVWGAFTWPALGSLVPIKICHQICTSYMNGLANHWQTFVRIFFPHLENATLHQYQPNGFSGIPVISPQSAAPIPPIAQHQPHKKLIIWTSLFWA